MPEVEGYLSHFPQKLGQNLPQQLLESAASNKGTFSRVSDTAGLCKSNKKPVISTPFKQL